MSLANISLKATTISSWRDNLAQHGGGCNNVHLHQTHQFYHLQKVKSKNKRERRERKEGGWRNGQEKEFQLMRKSPSELCKSSPS